MGGNSLGEIKLRKDPCYPWLKTVLWTESLAIFRREQETKNHVPEIAGIGIQRVEPVLEPNRVRVAPQVTKILHRHERTIEEPVGNRLALHYITQDLTAIHRTAIECVDQTLLVGHCDFRIRLERVHVRVVGQRIVTALEFRSLSPRVCVRGFAERFGFRRLRSTNKRHVRRKLSVRRPPIQCYFVEAIREVSASLKLSREEEPGGHVHAIAARIIKLSEAAIRTTIQRRHPVVETSRIRQATEEIDVLLCDKERNVVDGILRRWCGIVIDNRDRRGWRGAQRYATR